MSRVAQKSRIVKSVEIKEDVYVGIDVHKKSYSIALFSQGAVVKTWTSPAEVQTLDKSLKPYKRHIRAVVYEAGPTGFGLARRLKGLGYPVCVVAPSQIPREPSPANKTDRIDCRKLATYLGTGLFQKFVTIPSRQEEDDRQLVRLREYFVRKLRQTKQQIKSLLLQHGIAQPHGLKHWSVAARQQLLHLKAGSGVRFALQTLLADFDSHESSLKKIQLSLEKLARTRRHARRVKILMSHPGVGFQTAIAFETELFKGRNFESADKVGAFLGLAPRVISSGQMEHRGPLLKRGNGTLRALLVECVWSWIRRDPGARSRFGVLKRRTGSARKAVVAMARRLGIHLWKMLEKNEQYRVL